MCKINNVIVQTHVYISYIYFSLTCVVFDGIIIFLGSKGLVSKPLNAVDRKLNKYVIQKWSALFGRKYNIGFASFLSFDFCYPHDTQYSILQEPHHSVCHTKAITRNKLTPSYLLRLDLTCCVMDRKSVAVGSCCCCYRTSERRKWRRQSYLYETQNVCRLLKLFIGPAY